MAEGDFDLKATLSLNSKNFIDGLKQGKESLGSFSQMIDKVLGPKGKLVLALAAVGAAALKMGQDMNAAMSEIAKGTGATGESLYKLRENVHDAMINGVARSAQEVGKMIADLNTRFKVNGKELVGLTEQFDKFSNVTGIETSQAIEQTADVMKKWNIETEDSKKLMDQLIVASQESGASVETLLNGLKSGQAVFSQFGMSVTDTIAYISTLKENGIEVEQALIGMKTALAKFSQEGLDAQQAFKDVSERIKNASSETEALNIAVNTFGTRNGPEMVKVLRNSSSSVEEFKNKLLEAGGATERTFNAMRLSQNAIKELGSALKGSFGGIFEGIDILIKNVIDSLTSVLRKLAPIIKPVANSIRDIFATVGEMFFTLVDNVSTFITENSAGFKMIADIAQNTYEVLHTILGNTLEAFKTVFGLISSILQHNWPLAWEYAKQAFMIVVKTILDILSGFINTFSSQINTFTENVINPFIDGINLVAEKLGMPLVEKFEPIGKINLTQLSGLQKKIDETNKKIQEMTGKTTEKITGDLGKVEKTVYSVSSQTEKTEKKLEKESKKTALSIGEAFEKIAEEIKFNAEDWSDVVSTSYNAIKDAANQMMTDIGKGLAEGSLSYEDFAATAVDALAEVLKGLAAQLTAIAATKALAHNYAEAAVAAGAAAAALVSSGVLAGVASQMKSTASSSKDASDEISAVGIAAQGTYLTLQQFLDKVKQIKESFSGTSFGVVQYVVSSKKAFNEGYESLQKYNQAIVQTREELKKAQKEYDDIINEMAIVGRNSHSYNSYLGDLSWRALFASVKVRDLTEDLESLMSQYEKYLDELNKLEESMTKIYAETRDNLKTQIDDNKELLTVYENLYYFANRFAMNIANTELEKTRFDMLFNEQLLGIQQTVVEFYNNLSNVGMNIGETLFNAISENVTKNDFLKSIRDYIRTNLLKISIYTEDFQTKLANLGTKLAANIANGGSGLEQTRKDIDELWNTASTKAKQVDNILSEVFSDISDSIEVAEESLTSFEEAMDSFFDSINDLGGEIADGIISGLENGLDQGNFLDSMKQWIRKMLIQTVVYTDAMKSEIEAIGKAISGGLTKGFTETSLHEIRRDLSYIFNEANKTMGSIDSVLNTVFSGYANGTQNAMAGLHLVGESGPELVRFRGGEQVLNAQNTQAALENAGGTTNNFNVTFNNLQDTSAYAMMSQLRAYNREMAINGVI